MTRFLVALLALASSAGAVSAQHGLPYEGSEFFRYFLHKQGFTPLSLTAEAFQDPRRSLIVCVGDAEWINKGVGGGDLLNFVKAGGAVLIATDQASPNGGHPNSWQTIFRISIDGVLLTANANECFDGIDGRPFVRPLRKPIFAAKDSPFQMFKGIEADGPSAVATDHPSEMAVRVPADPALGLTADVLAKYPADVRSIRNNAPSGNAWNNFAVSFRHEDSGGRLLVVADHSVFVNGLMKLKVNEKQELDYLTGNIPFTRQMIDWLKGPAAARTQCLFVDNGQVITIFAQKVQNGQDLPPELPPLPPDVLANLALKAANPIITDLQSRINPDKALERSPGRDFFRRALWFVLSLALALGIWMRLRRATTGEDRSRWAPLSALGGLLPKGSTDTRKRADLIDTGNVYEAARWRVRDRFDRLGGQPDAAGHMPPLLMADQSRQAVGLEQQVRRLWQIGYGPKPIPIPIHVWDRLNLDLERAVRLAGKGVWCFAAHEVAERKR